MSQRQGQQCNINLWVERLILPVKNQSRADLPQVGEGSQSVGQPSGSDHHELVSAVCIQQHCVLPSNWSD